MAYTTIKKSTDYFNTKLWTGTGSSNALTGVGFQPDWTWIKKEQMQHNHVLDAVRGVGNKELYLIILMLNQRRCWRFNCF